MAQNTETGHLTRQCAAALPQWTRVILDTNNQFAVAGATITGIGVVTRETFAANELVDCRLFNAGGTVKMICSEAMTMGEVAYCAADGEIQDSVAGTVIIGQMADTGSADQAIAEVIISPKVDPTV